MIEERIFRWIPVSYEELLPEPGTMVIAAFDDDEIQTIWQCWKHLEGEDRFIYLKEAVEKDGQIEFIMHRVTHWAERLTPPKIGTVTDD